VHPIRLIGVVISAVLHRVVHPYSTDKLNKPRKLNGKHAEAEVLKKLSLAKPAKVDLIKVWFGLSQLSLSIGRCTQPAYLQLIPQSIMKYLHGVSPLCLAQRVSWLNFLTKTPTSGKHFTSCCTSIL
jgi:hypothetical protein